MCPSGGAISVPSSKETEASECHLIEHTLTVTQWRDQVARVYPRVLPINVHHYEVRENKPKFTNEVKSINIEANTIEFTIQIMKKERTKDNEAGKPQKH